MAAVKGYVEKIKYRNEDNGYSVLSVTGADDGEEYILVGNFSYISEGELVEAAGRMTEHPIYGERAGRHCLHGTIFRLRCHQRHRGCFGYKDSEKIQDGYIQDYGGRAGTAGRD